MFGIPDKRAVSPHRFPLLRSGSVAIRPSSISRPTTPTKTRAITPKRVSFGFGYSFNHTLFGSQSFTGFGFLIFLYVFSIRQNRKDRLRFGLRLRKKPRENQSSSSNNNRAKANGCLRRCLADAKPRRTIRSTLTWTNIETEALWFYLFIGKPDITMFHFFLLHFSFT